MASLYLGQSEAEWKQLFDELKSERLAVIRGERYLQLSTGGKAFTRRVRHRDEIEADLGQAVAALQKLNPTDYGVPSTKTYSSAGGYQFK